MNISAESKFSVLSSKKKHIPKTLTQRDNSYPPFSFSLVHKTNSLIKDLENIKRKEENAWDDLSGTVSEVNYPIPINYGYIL